MKGFRRLSLKQLFAVLPIIFLPGELSLHATPPDIVEIREILVGSNDSVMALYEVLTENRGSHFFHGERLSFLLREIATNKEIERRVVSRVEYHYNFDTEETDRTVVETSELDLAAQVNLYGLSIAMPSYLAESIETLGWDLVVVGGSGDSLVLVSAETMRQAFGITTEEESSYSNHDRLVPVRVYTCFLSSWIFVEVARENDDGVDQGTRVVAIDREVVYRVLEE